MLQLEKLVKKNIYRSSYNAELLNKNGIMLCMKY